MTNNAGESDRFVPLAEADMIAGSRERLLAGVNPKTAWRWESKLEAVPAERLTAFLLAWWRGKHKPASKAPVLAQALARIEALHAHPNPQAWTDFMNQLSLVERLVGIPRRMRGRPPGTVPGAADQPARSVAR